MSKKARKKKLLVEGLVKILNIQLQKDSQELDYT
jgi:hypothetical protein